MNKEIRVRFAPSPTGLLHLGGVRTALYNYLFAKKNNGVFLLRIEDTDRTRFVEGSVENLINSLKELGIDYNEGPFKIGPNAPYFQSERLKLYHECVDMLIEKNKAYYCFCSKEELDEMRNKQQENKETTKYDGRCRDLSPEEIKVKLDDKVPYVVRMKMPNDKVFSFDDLIRGNVQIASDLVEDQVILKTDGFPTYHLAAVVDDHYMNISHVLRGEEWLYSTPKHIFLYESLGWEPPIWVHLPLLLNTDKSKLSKRHGDFSVSNYLNQGYLKEAIINFVALLGWHSADDKELFTMDELVSEFSLERIGKAGAIFDITKLEWMNGWYIRNLPLDYIADLCKPYFEKAGIDISDRTKYLKVITRARDQITKLPDVVEHGAVFYKEFVLSEENMAVIKEEGSQRVLSWFADALSGVGEVSKEEVSELIKKGSAELGIKGKGLYAPLRIALFGEAHGPDIPMLVDIYGVSECVRKMRGLRFEE
jgi:glutamyl-tRNA synthetase